MDDLILARVFHVLSVVAWIGGVAFVTTVAMPAIRRSCAPVERMAAFRKFEAGFSWQARLWVALAGLSGLWMVYRGAMWDRFSDPHLWWMHAMVCLWLLFACMLFVIEPLFLHRMMNAPDPAGRKFARMERLHRLLLLIALVTIAGATAGSHGFY